MTTAFWDALVIGAGPAGALAARLLATDGLATLMVDRQVFPRSKVCGGCLNRRSLGILAAAGLAEIVERLPSESVFRLLVARGGRTLELPVPRGIAISRRTLDQALAAAAVRAGAVFESGVSAEVTPEVTNESRTVRLRDPDGTVRTLTARIVVAADGLGHPSLRHLSEIRSRIASRSRIGVGALVESPSPYETGAIHMAVGRTGYVGLVRIGDGLLNIAAAVDPSSVRRDGAPEVVRRLLAGSGFPVPEGLAQAAWAGTPALTRHLPRPVSHRTFVVGDSAGYVEPFSGEGIAWALTDAAALPEYTARAIGRWTRRIEDDWVDAHRRRVVRHQRLCRLLRGLLRSPRRTDAAFAMIAAFPGLAERSVRWVNDVPSFVGEMRA